MAAVDLSRDESGTLLKTNFPELVRCISQVGPIAVETARKFLCQAAREIPFSNAESLWPLIVELRSL